MNAKQLVIDQALDQIKDTPTDQHCADQDTRRPCDATARTCSPQHGQADQREQVGHGMKQPIRERVQIEIRNTGGWVASAGKHVMPLQNLVEDDSIEESAEA